MKQYLKKMLVIALCACIVMYYFVSPVFAAYRDTRSHWAKDRIERWTSLGIFKGADNKFRPDDYITRGELATVLNNIMNYQDKSENTFQDLDRKFYTDALLRVNFAGVINGSGGKIRPKDKATREEVAAMLVKAFSINAKGQDDYSKFIDAQEISSWAVASVNAMAGNGYVNGDKKRRFNPKANITRAEIVTMLDNCIEALYSKEGTYSDITIDGNIIVNNPAVVLKNMKINGNVIISQGTAGGDVFFENVKINGDVIVQGGANLHITDSAVSGTLTVNKADGKIKLIASGTTTIEKVLLSSGATIDARSLKTGEIAGEVSCVEISSEMPAGHSVKLLGWFKLVINNAKGILIEAEGTIEKLQLNQKCQLTGGAAIKSIKVAEGADSVINGKKYPERNTDTSPSSPTSNQPSAKTRYTVTFQTGGGSAVPASSVVSGEKLSLPAAPTYTGYVFMGWYTDQEITTEFAQNTPITSNITLYAKWNGWTKPVIQDERFEDGYPKFTVTPDKKIKLVLKLKDSDNEKPVDVFMLVNQMNPLFDAASEEVIHGHCAAPDGPVEVDEAPFIQLRDSNEHEIVTQVKVKGTSNIKMYFVLRDNVGLTSKEPVVLELMSDDAARHDITAPGLYTNGVYINRTYDKITLYFDEALDTASIPTPGAFSITRNTDAFGGSTSPGAISITGISLKNISPDKGAVELSIDRLEELSSMTVSYIKPEKGGALQDSAAVPNRVESFSNMPVKTVRLGTLPDDVAVSKDGKYMYIKLNFALLYNNPFDIDIYKGRDTQHLTTLGGVSDVLRIWSNAGDYHKMYIRLDNVPELSEGDRYIVYLTPAPKDGTAAANYSGDSVNNKFGFVIPPSTVEETGVTPASITYSSGIHALKVNFPHNNLLRDGGIQGCLFTLKAGENSYTLRGKLFSDDGQIAINQENSPVNLEKIDWSEASLSYSALIHEHLDSDYLLTYKSGMPYGGFDNVPITVVP